MKKKFLSYALAVFLAVTSMPMIALADTGNTPAKGNAAGEGAGVSDPQSAVTATFEDTTIYGTINNKGEMFLSYSALEITLNGATFVNSLKDKANENVSSWFKNLPKYFIPRVTEVNNNVIEITIGDKQEGITTGSGEMTITIPGDCIVADVNTGDVNVTGTVKYSILDKLTGTVTIDNNRQDATAPKVGDTLTANTGSVTGLPTDADTGVETTYKWYHRNTKSGAASNETLIGTKASYTLKSEDVGNYIQVKVGRSDASPANYLDVTTAEKVLAPDNASNLIVGVDDTGTITVAENVSAGDERLYYVVEKDKADNAQKWTVVTTKTDVEAALGGSGSIAMPTLTTADNGKYLVVVDFSSGKVVAYGKSDAINIPDNVQIVKKAVEKVNNMSESAFQYKNTMDGLDWVAVQAKIEEAVQAAIEECGEGIGVAVNLQGEFTPATNGASKTDKQEGSFKFTVTLTKDGATAKSNELTGKITPITVYTITFNGNGGSGEMAPVKVTPKDNDTTVTYTLPECDFAVPDGKWFKGWADRADGEVITGGEYDVSQNTTFYAIWEGIPEKTVESIAVTTPPNKTTYQVGETLDLTGMVVTATYNDKSTEVVTEYTCTPENRATLGTDGKVTVTITYEGKTATVTIDVKKIDIQEEVTVTFDANEGVLSGDSKMTTKDGKLSTLPTATRSGYTLKGWFTAKTGGEQVTTNTVFNTATTVYAQWQENSSGGGGGGSKGGSSKSSAATPSTENKTETKTVTNPDGSTTTTVTNSNGSSVETTTYPDGAKTVVETDENGAQVITETRADGTAVRTEISKNGATTASVALPDGADSVTVTIPTEGTPTAGTVAMIVNPDGSRDIILYSVADKDGLTITLAEDAKLEIVDNAKDYTDVSDSSWAKNPIDFVTARELFFGVSETEFGHDMPMNRAMLMTVLARLDGKDTSGGSIWYEKGMDWAKANGVSDGTNPENVITREQLAAMMYRYAGSPATSESLDGFTDNSAVSDYAADAMRWAVEQGIISGMGDGTLAPQGDATRAQVAAMLTNFINAMH